MLVSKMVARMRGQGLCRCRRRRRRQVHPQLPRRKLCKRLPRQLPCQRRRNPAQKARAENVGILIAAGLIAGEGLTGLFKALWKILFLQNAIKFDVPRLFSAPSYWLGLLAIAAMAWYLIYVPIRNAGKADEPPPPSAVM